MKLKSENFKRKKPHKKYMKAEVESKTDRIYSMIRIIEVDWAWWDIQYRNQIPSWWHE